MKKDLNNRNGVFANITGKNGEVNKIIEFITDTKNIKNQPQELKVLTDLYEKKVGRIESTLDALSSIEEVILQIRAKETISDIKLSLVRDYVYARSSFYRHNKKVKDIRIIVDRLENFKKPFVDLQSDKKVLAMAKKKLSEAMDIEIVENIKEIKKNIK